MTERQLATLLTMELPEELYREFKWALLKGVWRCGLPFTDKQRLTCQRVVLSREGASLASNTCH